MDIVCSERIPFVRFTVTFMYVSAWTVSVRTVDGNSDNFDVLVGMSQGSA